MKRWVAAAIAAGTVMISGTALADCDGAPGDAVMTIPKGKAVRVMYLRAGPENNYLEVCTRTAAPAPWLMDTGEFANASDWYLLWEVDPRPADYQINLLGVHFGKTDDLVPWPGMRRTTTPFGFTLSWYDKVADQPNTIVEVCILADLKACPAH